MYVSRLPRKAMAVLLAGGLALSALVGVSAPAAAEVSAMDIDHRFPGNVSSTNWDIVASTIAQTFTPQTTGALNRIDFDLGVFTTEGHDGIQVEIREVSPQGQLLASDVAPAGGSKSVAFTDPATVVAGETYAMVFAALPTDETVSLRASQNNRYADGTLFERYKEWVAVDFDIFFATYVDPALDKLTKLPELVRGKSDPEGTSLLDPGTEATVTLVSGNLPPGMELTTDGMLAQAATETGAYLFTVRVSTAMMGPVDRKFLAIVREPVPPGAPVSVVAESQSDGVVVSYAAPASSGDGPIESYIITATPGGGTCESTTLKCTFDGLENATEYTFTVVARSGFGAGPASAASAPVTTPSPPSAPEITSLEGIYAGFTAEWTAPEDNGSPITAYEYRYSSDGKNWYGAEQEARSVEIVVWENRDLSVRVRAINGIGAGPWSEVESVRTKGGPGVVENLEADPAVGNVALNWEAPSETGNLGELSYYVDYRPTGTSDWSTVVTSDRTKTIGSLTNNIEYEFQVRARNDLATGNASDAVAATPVAIPTTPTITATRSQDGAFYIAWDEPSNTDEAPVATYELRYRVGAGEWSTVTDLSGTSADIPVANGHTYQVQMRAVNGSGASGWTDSSTARAAAVPLAPRNMTGVSHDGSFSAAWTTPASSSLGPVDYYEARYRSYFGGDWVVSDRLTETSLEINIPNGIPYAIQLRAVNETGAGPWTDDLVAWAYATPEAVQSLAATSGEGEFSVSWSEPANILIGLVDSYELRYRIGETPWKVTSDISTTELTVSAANGFTYDIQVRAVGRTGNGPWSNAVSARALAVPQAPAAVGAESGDEKFTVRWAPPLGEFEGPADEYEVRYRLAESTEWNDSISVEGTTLLIAGVNGESYEAQVRAINEVAVGPWSSVVSERVIAAPNQPRDVNVEVQEGTFVTTWAEPAESRTGPADYYELRYRAEADDWLMIPSFDTEVTVTAENGTSYEIQVRAVNTTAPGEWSSPVTAAVVGIPNSPTGAIVTHSDGKFSLSWQKSSDATRPATSYEVQYRVANSAESAAETADSEWESVSVLGSEAEIPAQNSVIYEARIRALNAAGESVWSEPVLAYPHAFARTLSLGGDASSEHQTLLPGDPFVVSAEGLPSDSRVTIELHSKPVILGYANIGADGSFTKTVNIPMNTAPGSHSIVVQLEGPGGIQTAVTIPITVQATPAVIGELARSGADFATLPIAMVLLAFGVMLTAYSRRRIN